MAIKMLPQMKVSAVLLSYARQYHLPAIVENLRKFDCIDDIWVVQNEHAITDEVRALGTHLLYLSENTCTLGRFIAMSGVKHSHVFLQDDDLLVHNVDELVAEAYQRDGETIVANLAQDKSSRHFSWWRMYRPEWVELGFGSVVPAAWATALDDWPYDHEILMRKADKVFTVLHPWVAIEAGPDKITRLYHQGLESGRDRNALSLRRDHKSLTETAVKLTQEWKPR